METPSNAQKKPTEVVLKEQNVDATIVDSHSPPAQPPGASREGYMFIDDDDDDYEIPPMA